MTQCERIMEYIKEFGSITTLEAFQDLGVTRLASRIHDLYDAGYEFKREMIKGKNRYGETVHFMRYSLKEGKEHDQSQE